MSVCLDVVLRYMPADEKTRNIMRLLCCMTIAECETADEENTSVYVL